MRAGFTSGEPSGAGLGEVVVGCYLAMSFMIIPVMVAALFSPWVSAGFALIGAVVAVVAALAARRMITEVTRAHAEMLNS